MRLMWTPPTLQIHPIGGLEHQKLEMLAIVKEFENVEIRVEGGVDLGFGIIDFVFPMWHYRGNSFIVQCFYMGHMSMKIKLNANIGCIMSLKWSHVR